MEREPTDETLLRDSATTADAFAIFYRRHAAAVLVYMHRATHDAHAAADLTAETFTAAYSSRARFRPGEAPARAWLFGIANNIVHEHRRKLRRGQAALRRLATEPGAYTDEALARAEEQLSALTAKEALEKLLDGLPADERRAVEARIVEELEYAEVAETIGVSEQAARQRVSRGMRRLRAGFKRADT